MKIAIVNNKLNFKMLLNNYKENLKNLMKIMQKVNKSLKNEKMNCLILILNFKYFDLKI